MADDVKGSPVCVCVCMCVRRGSDRFRRSTFCVGLQSKAKLVFGLNGDERANRKRWSPY